jgi:GNAT superfamily N-acetyltransferase
MRFHISKGYEPGCIGRLTELHSTYYSKNNGFGLYFEAKVASGLAEFMQRYDDKIDGIWLALVDGKIEGAIAIDSKTAYQDGAHLRWFIVSDKVRGTGCGSQLLKTAIKHCEEQGFSRTYLWTFEGLAAARHLYEKHGFTLAQEQIGSQWGVEVKEQRFELLFSSSNSSLNSDPSGRLA